MKRKLVSAGLSLLMLAGVLTGCSGKSYASTNQPVNAVDSLDDTLAVAKMEELDASYVDGLNTFAYKIFGKLNKEENVFISPYSISLALSMIYNGADDDTRTEMAELLGYDDLMDYTKAYSEKSNAYMNANSKYLIDNLQAADPFAIVDTANSIWVSEKADFEKTADMAFMNPVRNYYNGDVFQVDFLQQKTLNKVNDWVSDKTKGMINPFLDSFQDKESLQLFLVNAIYFNGQWSKQFDPKDTKRALFHGTNSDTSVDMMYQYGEKYRYYAANGIKGVELPYGNGRLVMDVLIPGGKDNKKIDQVYGSLTAKQVKEFLTNLEKAKQKEITNLALPKFEMEYGMVDLSEALQSLGMEKAFAGNEANFDLIKKGLSISRVAHKAKIQVEEKGTKASAATGIECVLTSLEEEKTLDFIVDVPFVFFIRDTQTGAILFAGKMNCFD